ncbi:PqqD family protein [Paraclostridium bifermentans]|uniref:PqqD family protein n=1 Tax=Paraclostridium bifermentans TaxID=1490 RepID=UPI0018A9516C|nr:PqqD family peptide modification chaperone [Paraclostridium bifermentans]
MNLFTFLIEKIKALLKIKTVFIIPKSVDLNENLIFDKDLNKSITLNGVAYEILKLVNGKNTIDDIVIELLKKYNVKKTVLERDVINILSNLQDKNLVESKVIGNKILVLFLNISIFQYVYKKRYSVSESKLGSLILLLYVVTKKLFVMWIITFITIYLFKHNLAAEFNEKINYAIDCYIVFILSIISGFVMHEWIHIAVSKIQNKEFCGYILARRFTVSIVKVNTESSLLSILLGPLIPSILGIIIIAISIKIQSIMIFTLGIGFAINVINLLPFTQDGKGILRKILMKKLMKGAIK